MNSGSKSETEKKQLAAKSIPEEKIINHETTEVVDETLEESDSQSKSIVENQTESMETDHSDENPRKDFPVEMESVHDEKKSMECNFCDSDFKSQDELKCHT